ncbi:hypothetical protein X777_00457, partial [Ooceraea biroi]
CISLIAKQKRKILFVLYQIVTGDEKWIYYNNPKCKKHLSDWRMFAPETVKEQLPQSLMVFKSEIYDELFGLDQRFWETPSTRKKEPMAPMNHHLRAKRSVSRRGAVLRSSMVSGHLGNVRRYEAVMAGMEQLDDRLRGSALGTATPMEYVDLFRKSYKEKQKQESNV